MQLELESFLDDLTDSGLSRNTRNAYRADLRDFTRYLTSVYPEVNQWLEVGPIHLTGYARHLQAEGRSPATVARRWAALGRFFAFLGRDGTLPEVPSAEQTPQEEDGPAVEARLQALEDALAQPHPPGVSAAGMRDRLLVGLLWETGATPSEIAALDMGDFDGQTGVLCVGAEGSRSRSIPLTAQAASLLADFLARRRGQTPDLQASAPLFPNQWGRRLTRQGIWHIVRSWTAAAGIADPIPPRLLRRAARRRWLRQGLDRENVAQRLGLADSAAQAEEDERPLLLLDGQPAPD